MGGRGRVKRQRARMLLCFSLSLLILAKLILLCLVLANKFCLVYLISYCLALSIVNYLVLYFRLVLSWMISSDPICPQFGSATFNFFLNFLLRYLFLSSLILSYSPMRVPLQDLKGFFVGRTVNCAWPAPRSPQTCGSGAPAIVDQSPLEVQK